jgi:hypothetical protein
MGFAALYPSYGEVAAGFWRKSLAINRLSFPPPDL